MPTRKNADPSPVSNVVDLDQDQFKELADAQELGAEVDILGPDGITPLGLTIVVAGPDSKQQRRARQRQINARLRRRGAPPTAEDIRTGNIELLAESTLSWSKPVRFKGRELAFSVENAVLVYGAFPFIADQIDAVAGSRESFLKK